MLEVDEKGQPFETKATVLAPCDEVVLHREVDVVENALPKKKWEVSGKPKAVLHRPISVPPLAAVANTIVRNPFSPFLCASSVISSILFSYQLEGDLGQRFSYLPHPIELRVPGRTFHARRSQQKAFVNALQVQDYDHDQKGH